MADESLEVLSEIHLETTEQPGKDGTLLTRFFAQIPTIRANVPPPQVDSDSEIELDADGDVLVPRRTSSLVEQEFHVPHAMGTHIADVGLQVWAGTSRVMVRCWGWYQHPHPHFCYNTPVRQHTSTHVQSHSLTRTYTRAFSYDHRHPCKHINYTCSLTVALLRPL
eukprot:m.300265 g.300265  ORF g.300265 m.300265 type:complete len:166 (-) comp20126_c1_seq2:2044-2541(-)